MSKESLKGAKSADESVAMMAMTTGGDLDHMREQEMDLQLVVILEFVKVLRSDNSMAQRSVESSVSWKGVLKASRKALSLAFPSVTEKEIQTVVRSERIGVAK